MYFMLNIVTHTAYIYAGKSDSRKSLEIKSYMYYI